MQSFEDFVRQRDWVNERHLPFYLKWVLRFLRSEFDRERLSSSDLLHCFSDQLARDDTLEDWQRRQAVEMYLNVFLPSAGGEYQVTGDVEQASRLLENERDARSTLGAEQTALERMKNLLERRL